MAITPNNFLGLEPLIVARLKDRLPPNVSVLSMADTAEIDAAHQPAPAVGVFYNGYTANAERPVRATAPVAQTWVTYVVARNLARLADGTDAREDAGAIASAVIDALHGWRVGEGFGTLFLTNAPAADYANGLFYLPLGWSVQIPQALTCGEQ